MVYMPPNQTAFWRFMFCWSNWVIAYPEQCARCLAISEQYDGSSPVIYMEDK